jgi:hypothetical protein
MLKDQDFMLIQLFKARADLMTDEKEKKEIKRMMNESHKLAKMFQEERDGVREYVSNTMKRIKEQKGKRYSYE